MPTTEQSGSASRVLGYGGLLLAIGGAISIIVLGGNTAIAIGILLPMLATVVVASLPVARDDPLIWLVTEIWTAAIGAISIFSVGIIFLIATIFLLAAFLRASW